MMHHGDTIDDEDSFMGFQCYLAPLTCGRLENENVYSGFVNCSCLFACSCFLTITLIVLLGINALVILDLFQFIFPFSIFSIFSSSCFFVFFFFSIVLVSFVLSLFYFLFLLLSIVLFFSPLLFLFFLCCYFSSFPCTYNV